ncbi:hypothetical protein DFP72DRAFT_1073428 [Ephemerocybe angulata]|uniref:Uncharacterized protein n=1 Tax=Ephemerocybe angulata TaxID=980116 RepID=A0A8H6HLN8_9AGAR|nr:hypothetical protein DFP72DRAFT_1073428 [Tulosesus angulatus]
MFIPPPQRKGEKAPARRPSSGRTLSNNIPCPAYAGTDPEYEENQETISHGQTRGIFNIPQILVNGAYTGTPELNTKGEPTSASEPSQILGVKCFTRDPRADSSSKPPKSQNDSGDKRSNGAARLEVPPAAVDKRHVESHLNVRRPGYTQVFKNRRSPRSGGETEVQDQTQEEKMEEMRMGGLMIDMPK